MRMPTRGFAPYKFAVPARHEKWYDEKTRLAVASRYTYNKTGMDRYV